VSEITNNNFIVAHVYRLCASVWRLVVFLKNLFSFNNDDVWRIVFF